MKWKVKKINQTWWGTCKFCVIGDIEQVMLSQEDLEIEIIGYRCIKCKKIKHKLSTILLVVK